MAWALYLLTVLLSFISGVTSQSWTQPAVQSVSLGQTTKLSCDTNSESYIISWYQQKVGLAPRYVHYPGGSRGEGIPARFTASVSGSTGYLTITDIQAEDEADYYCAKWTSSGTQWVFGGGTQLTVTDPNQPSVPPNVNLFPPSVDERESKNKATLVCLVEGFTPPDITVTWLADDTTISTGVETTKPTKLNEKYVASSYLTLNPSEWESRSSYSCKVTHKGIDYVKSVGHSGSQCL